MHETEMAVRVRKRDLGKRMRSAPLSVRKRWHQEELGHRARRVRNNAVKAFPARY
jgi:hypothetical protein